MFEFLNETAAEGCKLFKSSVNAMTAKRHQNPAPMFKNSMPAFGSVVREGEGFKPVKGMVLTMDENWG